MSTNRITDQTVKESFPHPIAAAWRRCMVATSGSERLLDLITHPFEVRDGCESYADAAPSEFTKCYKTFCGT
jgi:hypothetical protein